MVAPLNLCKIASNSDQQNVAWFAIRSVCVPPARTNVLTLCSDGCRCHGFRRQLIRAAVDRWVSSLNRPLKGPRKYAPTPPSRLRLVIVTSSSPTAVRSSCILTTVDTTSSLYSPVCPPPPTMVGRQHRVFGLSVRPSGRPLSVNTYSARRDIDGFQ